MNSISPIFLLDTVAAIGFLNVDSILIASMPANALVVVPIIVLGELYAGAQNSSKVTDNVKRVTDFASKRQILLCDEDTAQQYGILVTNLRKKGRPIPQNDIWIAALALQHDLTLLTRDSHFQHIDGLKSQSWS